MDPNPQQTPPEENQQPGAFGAEPTPPAVPGAGDDQSLGGVPPVPPAEPTFGGEDEGGEETPPETPAGDDGEGEAPSEDEQV